MARRTLVLFGLHRSPTRPEPRSGWDLLRGCLRSCNDTHGGLPLVLLSSLGGLLDPCLPRVGRRSVTRSLLFGLGSYRSRRHLRRELASGLLDLAGLEDHV